MIFSIELQRLPDGRVKASTSTETDGLWAIRRTVKDAILAVSPEDTDVQLPEATLGLGDPEVSEPPIFALVAVDGDSDHMRRVLNHAIADDRDVRMDYTDAQGNETQRVVTPTKLERMGGGMALFAEDNGTPKQFYLYRIDRAEVVQ